MNLSEKDKALLNALIKNGRSSYDKLSKKTGMPVSTVHRRIKSLEKKGLIKGYEPIIDYSKLGFGVVLFMVIDLQEGIDTKVTIDRILKFKNVLEADLLQGSDYDILIKARCKDLKEVDKIVKAVMRVEGVEEVDSMVSGVSEKETLVFEI